MPPATKSTVIVPEGALSRSSAQRGLGRPRKCCDARQRPFRDDRLAAGRLAPISALFVNHDVSTSLIPHALNWTQTGSVSGHLAAGGMV
jgi:hypothetical protein